MIKVYQTKVINLFAGPGAGKSTTAAALFAVMKSKGHSVELIHEFAKELTWEHSTALQDQLFVTANQNRRVQRLVGQVEFIISDSPILIGQAYVDDIQVPLYYKQSLKNIIWDTFSLYDNMNFNLVRLKPYSEAGRNQTLEQAMGLDDKILKILVDQGVPYKTILGDMSACHNIYKQVFGVEPFPRPVAEKMVTYDLRTGDYQ